MQLLGHLFKAGHNGPEGETALSGHPRGTTDPLVVPDKQYASGDELFEAAKPVIDTNLQDLEIGLAADKPRRDFLNAALIKEGVIQKLDAFSEKTDAATVAKAKKFLTERNDIMIGAAKAFDPN